MTQPAPLRRRIGAMLYDGILLWAVLMLVAIPFIAARGGDAVEPMTDTGFRLALGFTIYLFFVGFWVRAGRTLGMQSWRLQLVNENHEPVGIGAATLRFFAALLSWAPAGLGFLWQLLDKDKLAWHDRLSGTRLLFVPKEKTLKESSSADT